MKAEDLMIGDWVNIYGDNWHVTLATLQLAWDKPDKIKPIPLTPEILEKNGFEKHPSNLSMFLHHDNYRLCYYFNSSNRFSSFNITDGSLVQKVIVNVHELQHALKLCEIDKEIVV